MIDTHMHADSRSGEDFRDMYLAGLDTAITCSFYPYKIDN
jgi:predicted metal-dependent TIM-barrel fold hydrolase